jgi:hypothetical protein
MLISIIVTVCIAIGSLLIMLITASLTINSLSTKALLEGGAIVLGAGSTAIKTFMSGSKQCSKTANLAATSFTEMGKKNMENLTSQTKQAVSTGTESAKYIDRTVREAKSDLLEAGKMTSKSADRGVNILHKTGEFAKESVNITKEVIKDTIKIFNNGINQFMKFIGFIIQSSSDTVKKVRSIVSGSESMKNSIKDSADKTSEGMNMVNNFVTKLGSFAKILGAVLVMGFLAKPVGKLLEVAKPAFTVVKDVLKGIGDAIKGLASFVSCPFFCCLKKGSKILCENDEWRNIEDLVIGDFVIDHEGNLEKIISIGSKFEKDKIIYDFYTDNHPRLVNGRFVCFRKDAVYNFVNPRVIPIPDDCMVLKFDEIELFDIALSGPLHTFKGKSSYESEDIVIFRDILPEIDQFPKLTYMFVKICEIYRNRINDLSMDKYDIFLKGLLEEVGKIKSDVIGDNDVLFYINNKDYLKSNYEDCFKLEKNVGMHRNLIANFYNVNLDYSKVIGMEFYTNLEKYIQ